LAQGVFFHEPSVLEIPQDRFQYFDNTLAACKPRHLFGQRYDKAESVLPVPHFQFAEQPSPIKKWILQGYPGEALSRADIKVRPIQCVEQELGWISQLTGEMSKAGIAQGA
jgi:hypothetical protein